MPGDWVGCGPLRQERGQDNDDTGSCAAASQTSEVLQQHHE